MEKINNSAKSLEIPIYFHNYKLLKDKEIILKGSNIYFVQGPNKVGKTSFLKALTSLQVVQDDTPKKVTHGESEGYYEATIPAADGSMITIRHEFTDDGKGKFYAVREDGTKISQVTEIRNLFNYTPIDVSQFFAMSNSAEGRRKQRDIILKLLTEKERKSFNEYDLQEQHYYDQRTEKNRILDQAKNNAGSVTVSEGDVKLLTRKSEAEQLIELYGTVLQTRNDLKSYFQRKEELLKQRKNLELQIEQIDQQLKDGMGTEIKTADILEKYQSFTDDQIKEKIQTGKTILERITAIKTRLDIQSEWTGKQKAIESESASLTLKITECREAKEKIIAESELPVENISFEDGYLTIDGFQFKENQVCESDAVILLANILAKINPGPIQVIGDASILDYEKLEKLNKIAEANNKVMFVDEVIRDATDIVVVGYEDMGREILNERIETNLNGKKQKKLTKKQQKEKEKAEFPETPNDGYESDGAEKRQEEDDALNNDPPTENLQGEDVADKPLF